MLGLYQEIVDALNRELSPYERVKRIALLPAEFTIESGELTPTLKVKRKIVEQKWRAEIDRIYEETPVRRESPAGSREPVVSRKS